MKNSPLRILTVLFLLAVGRTHAQDKLFVPPATPRQTFNFNPDWKFLRSDAPGAEAAKFDDAKWETVSTPHTWNDADTYRKFISHGSGDRSGQYLGVGWYRKHFKLPASAKGGKVFLESEGMRQAGRFFLNGQPVGKCENGITAAGFDLTPFAKFGDEENVLAVKVDNSKNYVEEASGTGYQWAGGAFNPNYGGLNRSVWLHLTGKVYQTLPLYEGLQTTGVYVYAEDFNVAAKTAKITVEAQVKNEEADNQVVTLNVVVVDAAGQVRAKFSSDTSDMVHGQKDTLTASGALSGVRFWSVDDPYLYDVYSILTVEGKAVDASKVRTGFRKAEYKGGVGKGGVWINDRFVYLQGFAQRSVNDWAGLGQAYPAWMHDLTAALIRGCHGNYIRWMHTAPQRVDVEAFDRAGIVEICPAGDKEGDVEGRQWEQRVEVMRDSMIYFRNQPSILFWEAGNNGVTAAHLQQMIDLRKEWDPHGGRAMGCRTLNDPGATPIAEYFGVMVGQDARTDKLDSPTAAFRAYSAERRDRAPFIETEDFRDEGARRFWDDFSPPHMGFKKGPDDTYDWNSETFALAAAVRFHEYDINRISNPDPAHSRWAGYASIYFSDSNADGRQQSSEVCRVSGKVDSMRLPKEIYFVHRVMQSAAPDLHIIGHWTYPAATKKTVYVAASHCDTVELFVNGQSKGKITKPTDGVIFAFPDIAFAPGAIKAVGTAAGKAVCQQEIQTAGPAKSLKLTPITGPNGLQADGADVALFDVEAVDAQGHRCPTDEARVDFKLDGPAIWRGGYNSGLPGSTNNLYLSTECGLNRVAIRSTLKPGAITLTATRDGLQPATARIEAKPVETIGGLTRTMPPR